MSLRSKEIVKIDPELNDISIKICNILLLVYF